MKIFPLTAQPSLTMDIFFLKSDVRLSEALAGHFSFNSTNQPSHRHARYSNQLGIE